ncbi:MAG: cobalamin-binding protein [Pseudomonadota bacterium]
MAHPPQRIVCLTEETVETLYLLGEEARIVGVTGYAVRPARVRQEKPRVGAFTSADIPKILALEPDLVLTFSDLQAEIAAGLVREGIAVHAFNQRSVDGILDMVGMLGAMVGCTARAEALVSALAANAGRATKAAPATRPRVYFEEWNEPIITGIGWVSELIEIAGGQDCFAHLRTHQAARDRVIAPEAVVAAAPDIIIGSWCGKKFAPAKVSARPGWGAIPAVATGRLYEIKSPLILQPGPAALSDGLAALSAIIRGEAEPVAA